MTEAASDGEKHSCTEVPPASEAGAEQGATGVTREGSKAPKVGPLCAGNFPVALFRQTLLWPLVLDSEPDEGWFEKECNRLSGSEAWTLCEDPLELIPDEDGTGVYEEAVYFHDFVRNFLYRKDADAPMRVYSRNGPAALTAVIDGTERRFAVQHCALHLFELGVAILSLDLDFVSDAQDLTMADAQKIIDRLRRAYAPFWFGDRNPGYCPTEVFLDDEPCGLGRLETRSAALAALKKRSAGPDRLVEPLFPWWSRLLAPLAVAGSDAQPNPGAASFRQVLDERIPLMTTLQLAQLTPPDAHAPADPARVLELVSEGDWFRLAGADGADDHAYPYNPEFLRSRSDNLFYDRFMASPDTDRNGATRFLFMGYHFAAVGSGNFFRDYVAGHMRRHYRQMNLIAYLEFAALLMLSNRLSRAARLKDSEERRRAIITVEKDFLVFTHRYRFTGVSNQLQAREMFDQLRRSMGLDLLYKEVKEEIDTAAQFALAEEQHEQSETVLTLTEIATLGLVLSVIVGAFGMNIVVDTERWGLPGEIALFGLTVAILSGATALLLGAWPALSGERPGLVRVRRPLYVLTIIGFIMFFAVLIWEGFTSSGPIASADPPEASGGSAEHPKE
ncbi:hypothetical protein LNKW23_45640 [Paralimibaculum aggregatum]|uniref:CorA-like Mg2+ transporter protein n=1 Tax=Paralimibaculum aggregatum TaxID=3036245 RepID=A0ABQ6LTC9_9RHOB|nr:hypothetical protein [Limibaculum sp. NKW23]GMG85344.1 hypothetical protein LNKW23_45640 [Limibaculum sp. NKW23]